MLQRLQPNDKPKRKEFADYMLQRISEDEELLTASSTNPVSINFLCHRRIEELGWWIFSMLSPVPMLSLNVRFCFNEPGYTWCLP